MINNPIRVLVTDGNTRPALAATRSLARRGYKVTTASETSESLSGKSKYCLESFIYPEPKRKSKEFLEVIRREIQKRQIDILLPMTEITTNLILQEKSTFEINCKVPFPDYDLFTMVSDKGRLIRIAQEYDIPIPGTVFVDCPEEICKYKESLSYPIVVKPTRSRIPIGEEWISAGVRYADTYDELQKICEEDRALQAAPFMLQQYIEGEGRGVFYLYDKGKPLVIFAHRRIREKPPTGGVSVLCESIPVNDGMREYGEKLLTGIGWSGVAMVEFKICRRTGVPYLMEVNGRFWGSLQLAIDAGVDFPYILCQASLSKELPQFRPYKTGVRNRWLLGDLDSLYLTLKTNVNGAFGLGIREKSHAIIEFLNVFQRNTRYETWDVQDPAPFFKELKCHFQRAKSR